MFFGGHAVHADDLSRDAEQTSSVVQKQSSEKIDVDAVKEADNVSNQRQDVPKGDKVPDPSTVVTNSNDIKDKIPDTTYTWKTTPDTPNTKVVINYKANNPGTPATPVTPPVDPGDNRATPVTPPVKPEQKPTTPTPHATKTPAKDNGGKKTVASEQKSTLPQTGKKDNVALTAIGVAIAAAGSLLGLADSKKHRS